MSDTKTKSIAEQLCENYDDVKLTPDHLEINGGAIKANVDAALNGVGGLIDLFITLSVPTVGFEIEKDAVKIDKVMTDFQLGVWGCHINKEKNTCRWADDKRYSIITGEHEFNIKVYHEECELESEKSTNKSDPWWLLELPPMISKQCSDEVNAHVCKTIKQNSTDDEIRAVISSLLENWIDLDKD